MWLFYLIIAVRFRNSLLLQCVKEIGEDSVLHSNFQLLQHQLSCGVTEASHMFGFNAKYPVMF
jgi:hypothetical protein